MKAAQPPDAVPGSPHAAALGLALGERLPSFLQRVNEPIELVDRANPALPAAFRERERYTRQFAVMLIGRWLIRGEMVSEEEARWISEQGRVAAGAGLPITTVAKHYLIWRDMTIEFVGELAAELKTPDPIVRAAYDAIRVSSDAQHHAACSGL